MAIKLQLLLRKDRRTPEGLSAVREIAASLGIVPTASGAASVSGEIAPRDFESLFGETPREVAPRPPGRDDFGSPGGFESGPLRVPERLRDYVESITVAPPHVRMDGGRRGSAG